MENEKLSLPQYDIPEDIQNAVAITTLDRIYNWGRRSSVWRVKGSRGRWRKPSPVSRRRPGYISCSPTSCCWLSAIMETVPSIIIFAPVLLPAAKHLGVDPVLFGVLMVVNLSMGLASPPSGATLFVATAIADEPLNRVCRAVWPFFVSMVVILLILTCIPSLVMWLPRLVYGR